MLCLSMVFLCGFAHGYLKNRIWKIIWIDPFQLLLCMMIYLIGMLIICYPSIVFISKLSCYACVSIDDHVLIWFLHRMITRNTILFEFILLLYMRVCYLIVYSVLYLFEWDIPMSMCAMHILYAHWFFSWFICWTLGAIMLICHFDSFWITWMTSVVIGSINSYVFICPICISLDFGRLVHVYLLCVNSHALFALFDPIYIW